MTTSVQLPLFALEKRCNQCGALKTLDAFSPAKDCLDGRRGRCKACCAGATRAYKARHPDRTKAAMKRWREDHKEHIAAYAVKRRAECYEQIEASEQRYRAAHRAEIKARRHDYYVRTRDRQIAAARTWQRAHPDRVKEASQARGDYLRSYRERSREHARQMGQLYREKNREKALAASRRYKKAHPERAVIWQARRRAYKAGSGGTYSPADVQAMFAAQGGRCAYCDTSLETGYHVEHKIPVSRGGSSWPDNLCLSCATCNYRKWRRTDEEFRAMLATSAPRH